MMNNDMSFGDSLIYSSYIKYNKLADIINIEFAGSNATEINLYIDLYSVFKAIYNTNKNLAFSHPFAITSDIINMCAHYRNFFKTRYKVYTKIFLVYSTNDGMVYNTKFYPDYHNEYYNNYMTNLDINNLILNNVKMINLLCRYINDIAFVYSKYETGVVIYDIMQKEYIQNTKNNKVIPDIIISKDLYNMQLCSVKENIIMIRPKKNKGEDLSFSINGRNMINTYIIERKCSSVYNNINGQMLSLIMALTRVPERNIKSYKQIPYIIKCINDAINNGYILNEYNTDIEYICNILNMKYNLNIDPFIVDQRFKAIDIIQQYGAYQMSPEIKYEKMVNLYDPETVKKINNDYFGNHPLDLNVL